MEHALPAGTRDLGEIIGILAVDVRGFSKHNDVQQNIIAEVLPSTIESAARRVGAAELWHGSRFRAYRGDGYLIGFNPTLVGTVVDSFFDALQSELRQRAREPQLAGIDLRVRTSLNLGPVQAFDEILTDSPNGTVMVDTGRMVDSESVRALLDHSDPKVTFVASVLSRSVMDQVVRAGRTARQPSEFVEAPLEVEAKDYAGTGYLRVPVPSGDLLRSGLLWGQPEPGQDSAPEHKADVGPLTANTVMGNAEEAVQTRDVGGGIDASSARATSGGIAVTGNRNVTAGGNIDRSSNKYEYSGTFTTRGDSNFGASSGRRVSGANDSAEE
ncbi:hypothetical protein [Allokutzneria oryzae]|uniref:Guanylate cyclase domain-containing protein n=1 Tax=Allokutzneria oryzae TaxID=1378989 RepID=A0ABV5ZX92_9PSEU